MVRVHAGYEVEGLEKLPLVGPALIVYYHGTMPLDMYYLLSEFLIRRKRLIRCVADRYLYLYLTSSSSARRTYEVQYIICRL